MSLRSAQSRVRITIHRGDPMRNRYALLLSVLVGAAPVTASGQVVRGTLVDDQERAVGGASALLFDERGRESARALTAADGSFLLRVEERGGYWVRVEIPGFLTVESRPFFVGRGDSIDVRLATRPRVTEIEGVTVQARVRQNRNHAAFLGRQGLGWGRYLSPDELERLDPVDIAHALVGLSPGLALDTAGRLEMTGPSGRACDPLYFVDGGRVSYDYFDQLPASLVAAAEVYTAPNTIPAELTGAFSQCGAVAVWTRDGLGL